MISQRLCTMLNTSISFMQVRCIKTTTVLPLIQKWRKERGLPMNPQSHNELVNRPDYSFKDGRITPYGVRQKKRMEHQRELRDQIISLSGEIDFAVERHAKLQAEEENRKKRIIDAKLKPKGSKLLKSK
ncbi:mitochondrial ribosomal protein L52 [Leptinotarsa decemlineata]|uniref:mitochondrial ribosomal protein L52 n=1 Tax=Leptinotarsa decemlineata TaxID=7539 RepID=UPI000C2548CF|nr:39S ribosomal protein L52, mitochondrial [Leptinotarsa decemlineata]